jgi:transcriptional regulator with XRE-family HTH domain
MATLRKQFGVRLRQLRTGAGLTQEALAAQAELSVDFLSLVERGINAPSFENIERLAAALGVEPRELFTFGNAGSAP